ncbi:MAG: carbamoyl phosphate synthase small subunit [Treponema sp.]|jgi:carbamoyl-phosphate synthase small subunit|nr:carbamoyl phosphate synthase small subunit [Treponema sp.]
MNDKAYLILENGEVFEGKSFGAAGDITGEIVFTTGMTGYLETLTDPSYYGQIVFQTFPLIGNYGVISSDFESAGIRARAYIAKYPCTNPSNFRNEKSLDNFLKEQNIIGLHGIDTRRLTKIIRENGVMNGKICTAPPTNKDRSEAKAYVVKNAIGSVTSKSIEKLSSGNRRIALMDFGAKRGIANALAARGCEVWSFPCFTSAKEILKIEPNGIMLSNGPGDPADSANKPIIETIKELDKHGLPIFGICTGHLLLALAKGYKTRKLKFGHRGVNQPVKDTRTGNVYITSQNHGYEVIANDSLFINVNDGSNEGLDYGKSFSVQFHPEACSGPLDTGFLFDEIISRIN